MSVRDLDLDDFLDAVRAEVRRAENLFPSPDGVVAALAEETGEAVKAVLDEPWENVFTETVQTAAMAARLFLEGDPTLNGVRLKRTGTLMRGIYPE